MQFSLRSIYFQVLISFLLVIFATLTVSTIIEYYTYASQLPKLFTEVRTKTIAQHLSAAYTRDNGWDSFGLEIQRLNNLESLNTLDDATVRIIIRDKDGRTVYNSFSNITRIENSILIEGESQPVIDYKTAEEVGVITLYISQSYIKDYARGYVVELIKSGIFKGLITAATAIVLSLFFSRSITRPVILLTAAAKSVAEGGQGRRISSASSNELGQLSSTFNSMLSSLQAQQELRKQLISDISHEINTPLNAIRLEARGLSDGLVSADEASYHIINEVDALRNIIYDLDWLAETDSGSYRLNKEEYQISRLISEESERWTHKAEAHELKLVVSGTSAETPAVMIDVLRISTVIGNLIDNAIKYSPAGGRITIGCRYDDSKVIVTVCDDGPAIALEDRAHIFERFYRAQSGVKTQKSGRGLGLAIVRQIVELHQGSIRLECGRERGNCFLLSLPV